MESDMKVLLALEFKTLSFSDQLKLKLELTIGTCFVFRQQKQC